MFASHAQLMSSAIFFFLPTNFQQEQTVKHYFSNVRIKASTLQTIRGQHITGLTAATCSHCWIVSSVSCAASGLLMTLSQTLAGSTGNPELTSR